jgi:hypothetical protein
MRFKPLEINVVELFPNNRSEIAYELDGKVDTITVFNDKVAKRMRDWYGGMFWLSDLRARSKDFRLVLSHNQYDRFNLYLKDTKTGKRFTIDSMWGDATSKDNLFTKKYLEVNHTESV